MLLEILFFFGYKKEFHQECMVEVILNNKHALSRWMFVFYYSLISPVVYIYLWNNNDRIIQIHYPKLYLIKNMWMVLWLILSQLTPYLITKQFSLAKYWLISGSEYYIKMMFFNVYILNVESFALKRMH